ncbi:hypothetical protein BGZ60DRAFT_538134 [Tricladium varicosporioides]|nr:hypothetical protein BGZ60DRAFT_538134 [Hymenoscyphus varicosporioides]
MWINHISPCNLLLAPPTTLFTTVENPQETSNGIKLSPKRKILNILASTEISEISFDILSYFSKLKVLRCASKHDKGTSFIKGSSIYNDVRLDKWQAHRHKNHSFAINYERGVRIKLTGITDSASWARSRSDFTAFEREDFYQYFETLSHKNQWDEARSAVAVIMGIAVGASKFTMGLSAVVGGIYAKYTFGFYALELRLGGAKLTAIATAAGPAAVFGVGTATAIYFIPWDGFSIG